MKNYRFPSKSRPKIASKKEYKTRIYMKKRTFLILALLLPLLNFAQDSYEYENPVLLTDTIKLNEIIIQASKIDDNLQEIQAATSYISRLEIEEQNINSLTELTARIPNLYMPDYGTRLTAPIYIRGIGSRLNNPSVGLYVDDVPYFDKGTFNFEFFNLEKIEVLRGPQGTLYGRNTMGGIIKVYTPQPKFNSTANLKLEYGTNNHIKTTFETNQKLSERVAVIVGGAYAHSDGAFTNTFTDTKADNFDVYNGHFKLLYNPSEKFKSILSVNFENHKQNGYPYAIYDIDTQSANEINYNAESTYDRSLLSVGLTMEYHTNKFILSSATSFQHMEDYQGIDQDFTATDLYWVTQDRAQNSFVEEITIRSLNTSKVDWIAGLFAFNQGADKEVGFTYKGNLSYTKIYDQPTSGAAVFGQVSHPIGKFRATLGIRADYEKSTLIYEKQLGANYTPSGAFESDLDFTQVLPKASLSFHPNEDITIFTTVSKGYKAGGFNATFENDEDRTFDPEFSTNYELGIKSVCINNRLITNFNIFYIDWQNQQIYQPVPSGTGSMLDNAGHSESKGLELELRFLVNKNLSIWGAYGYTEAKYLDYQRDETTDYSGNLIPYIPEYTLNLGGNYTVNLNKKVRNATLTVNYQQTGKLFWNDANSAYQKSYGILNGRLNFHTKSLDFGLWGKNLINTDYNAFYFEIGQLGNSYVQLGKPAQYGAFIHFNI
ncbi:MAG: TonB-dependent receptor [Bacteroidales bacterium]|nr:TonB-dependent receptor [Bacteroidales bacterium]